MTVWTNQKDTAALAPEEETMQNAGFSDRESRFVPGRVLLQVRPNEVDPYGIAHHSNYAVWAELALLDYLRGLEKPVLLSDGKGGQRTGQELPSCRILRFQCKYLLSARLYDMVEASVIPGASKEDAQLFRFRIADARGRRLFAAGLLEVSVGNR